LHSYINLTLHIFWRSWLLRKPDKWLCSLLVEFGRNSFVLRIQDIVLTHEYKVKEYGHLQNVSIKTRAEGSKEELRWNVKERTGLDGQHIIWQ
jgi:hypothetical protein